MRIFATIVKNFIYSPICDEKAKFIFYKIVDSSDDGKNYLLQCINTYDVFRVTINDIVSDNDILYGLHPIQACYIGIEHSNSQQEIKLATTEKIYDISALYSRYGAYQLSHLNRKRQLSFFNKNTHEKLIMSPGEIAFSKHLIQEFDAIEAFYIGILTGVNLKQTIFKSNNTKFRKNKNIKLRLLQGGK